jgi:phosphoglycolate phosphatase-like HAD superfamily hydrolase
MIHDAMRVLGVSDSGKVLKVGDTQIDVQEAKNAKVYSIGVLTGTQSRKDLEVSRPDAILASVADLIPLLKRSRL